MVKNILAVNERLMNSYSNADILLDQYATGGRKRQVEEMLDFDEEQKDCIEGALSFRGREYL